MNASNSNNEEVGFTNTFQELQGILKNIANINDEKTRKSTLDLCCQEFEKIFNIEERQIRENAKCDRQETVLNAKRARQKMALDAQYNRQNMEWRARAVLCGTIGSFVLSLSVLGAWYLFHYQVA